MFYLIKDDLIKPEVYTVVEAVLQNRTRWTDAWGSNLHYQYIGINDDEGKDFDTRYIVAKTKAKSKDYLRQKYAELFI